MSCFQNLSAVVNETFAATVQSEDELTYASATLLLAGLLQLHARTPRYASHRSRLDSFPKHTHVTDHTYAIPTHLRTHCPLPSPSELATAGFFHTGFGDETVCPSCGLGLRDWQAHDQPEACHIAYSTAAIEAYRVSPNSDIIRTLTPSFPCLYLAVRRLLVSELPLARKSLVPIGPVQSVRDLPGVISRPIVHLSVDNGSESVCEYPSLAERLRAIVQIMTAPPAPQGWPVENARALGHSDDLIVLALWRLQAETAGLGLALSPLKSIHLDPHATTELLKAILHVQEGFDASFQNNLIFEFDDFGQSVEDELVSDNNMTAEDAETAALSRCRRRRLHLPQSAGEIISPHSDDGELHARRIRLPRFYQFLIWWSQRWSRDGTPSYK